MRMVVNHIAPELVLDRELVEPDMRQRLGSVCCDAAVVQLCEEE